MKHLSEGIKAEDTTTRKLERLRLKLRLLIRHGFLVKGTDTIDQMNSFFEVLDQRQLLLLYKIIARAQKRKKVERQKVVSESQNRIKNLEAELVENKVKQIST